MSEKRLLLGDEAVALGAIHAGLSGVYAYPGTPSTEITEFIQSYPLAKERRIRSRWCTNEKTAMEAALGMSYAGKRALVCMKHVGMNVCADAFINSAITGVNGGLIVLAADDPSMHSSQNEQDSRFYGKFAMIPIIEPSTQQEAFDMMANAFDLSERLKLPVLMRIVTRLAHSRAAVEINEARPQNEMNPDNDRSHWVLLPGNARRQYASLVAKQSEIQTSAEHSKYNSLALDEKKGLGVIAVGIGYNYVKEVNPQGASILKVSQYPLPIQQIKTLAENCSSILVVEDGQPFVEEQLKGILGADYTIIGRLTGNLPRTGELNPDNVASAFGKENKTAFQPALNLAGRPPQLCQGCGHRDVYTALNKVAAEYDAVNDKSNITVIISDNLTTAMTGGQDSAGTHKFEAICLALGVEREHLHVVVPLPKNMDEITRIIREEINYNGVSVIIPQRECMQTLNRKLRQKKQAK